MKAPRFIRKQIAKITPFSLSLLLGLTACSSSDEAPPAFTPPPVPVEVATAQVMDVPHYIQGIAKLSPKAYVEVRSEVSGKILETSSSEGMRVSKGDQLFLIDNRIYRAQVEKARASLLRSEAALDVAEKKKNRMTNLAKKDFVAPQNYDEVLQEVKRAEAQVLSDKADLELAVTKLEDCRIRSSIDGMLTRVLHDEGNTVHEGDLLSTVVFSDTLKVDFSLPEKFGKDLHDTFSGAGSLIIEVAEGKNQWVEGTLTFVDPFMESKTGTLSLRGEIPNDGRFHAGQFVHVRLKVKTYAGSTVVPLAAVQNGQEGKFIYVMQEDSTIKMLPIVPGVTFEDLILIPEGLSEGEKVVTDGQMNLYPGATAYVPAPVENTQEGQDEKSV